MADETGEMTVAKRLGDLLDRGLLPAGGPAEAAERLIERLERPARIALLGLPGAGKSSILNLLAGTVLVPEMLRLPTIVVQYGAEARMLCTLADGRTEIVPGSDLSQVMALNPALVTLETDLAALKVIGLLEVSAGPMEAEQRRAANWASKRADIVIWCTTSYLPKEQLVWESMPDSVKDNGFLFLTKVDLLGSREAAEGMLERVELRAGEEFRQVLSISAKQARTAMDAPGGLDRDMFRDSGAAAVISTIKTRVQMARRADMDMAELLLARHVEASSIVAKRFAEMDTDEAAPEQELWTPPPEDVVAPVLSAVRGTKPAPEPEPELEPEAEPEPEPQAHTEPEPEMQPEPQAEPVIAAEPEPVRKVPPVAEADPALPHGSKRFSDRLKQAPAQEDAPAAPLVPLRTTWKSPNETASPAEKPRAEPVAPPQSARRSKPAPEVGPESGPDTGPDDAVIAAMLASAAATPSQSRTARERPQRDGAAAKGPTTAPPGARAGAPQLFGSRKTTAENATDQPAPGYPEAASEMEARADIETDRPDTETPVTEAPARQPRTAEPVARIRAVAGARAPSSQPAEEPVGPTASPRVAVLRDRRPEPATPERTERRERPRIAARIATAAPAPIAPDLAVGPIPATEQALLEQAVNLITTRSAALAEMIDPDEKLPVDLILEHGRETTEQVIDLLSRGGSAALRRINGDLGEVLDLIMLMQLEKGHAPADDTITLLLQIRRDLETLLAA